MKYVLKKKLCFEDQEFTELDVDFDSLTGRDVAELMRELRMKDPVLIVALNVELQVKLALKSAGLSHSASDFLGALDFINLGNLALGALNDGD